MKQNFVTVLMASIMLSTSSAALAVPPAGVGVGAGSGAAASAGAAANGAANAAAAAQGAASATGAAHASSVAVATGAPALNPLVVVPPVTPPVTPPVVTPPSTPPATASASSSSGDTAAKGGRSSRTKLVRGLVKIAIVAGIIYLVAKHCKEVEGTDKECKSAHVDSPAAP